jgi:putative ABC transport system permease protein
MLKNYIITALRNIKREKFFALMNITGLALGIGCALVIYKVISYELSFDTHHKNYENVYRLVRESITGSGIDSDVSVPHPLGKALRNDFPEIAVAMTHYNRSGQITVSESGKEDRLFFEENGIAFVEPAVFDVFDFQFIKGNQANCLSNPNSVVITDVLAQKYFNLKENELNSAIGRSILLNGKLTATVSAIISNPPLNTDIPFKVFFKYEDQINSNYGKDGSHWFSNSSSTNCYLLLPERRSVSNLTAQFPAFIDKYLEDNASEKEKYILQPLSELHSNEIYQNYGGNQVTHSMLFSLGIIGLFLIITASINFINLTTAQAIKRSKEIGIRKTLGGTKNQLIYQFLGENILIAFIAAFIGLIISELLLVHLEDIIGYRLSIDMFSNPDTFFFLVVLSTVVGLLSGLYPAIMMSRMNPVMALKNSINSTSKSGILSLRHLLVIVQFTISQILIIGTLVVSMQIDYFMNKDMGFKKDSILTSVLPVGDAGKLELYKNKLLELPQINSVSFGLASPLGNSNSFTDISHPSLNSDDEYFASIKLADEEYLGLYELKLVAGRNYTKIDSSTNIVVNKKLTKLIGFNNPEDAIGEKLSSGWGGVQFNIIGVVDDFHSNSLHEGIDYVVFTKVSTDFRQVGIKFNTNNAGVADVERIVKHAEASFHSVFPDFVYDFEFYDDFIADEYEAEQRTAKLFQLFAIIAIFIGCLGLYGLVSYISNQKTKEIGIRKVLGASLFNILRIFSIEILVLILIAFAIAAPVGYISMSYWLNEFVYSINLSPQLFLIAFSVSLLIALLTIAYKSISASLANPVNSLKDE